MSTDGNNTTGNNTNGKKPVPRGHKATAYSLVVLVAVMVGLSYAAVPLYDLFCRVTGYGGTTQRADQGADRVLDQTITVRFDATVAGDLPWKVKPQQTTLTLNIGETGQMIYVARNLSHEGTVGTSSFNVSPAAAGIYFNKLECFCFTEQPLDADSTADMPVVFFVDPAIVDDKDTQRIGEITLSYAFFPDKDAKKAEVKPAAAAPTGADG
ncbi:cytochrome c oxidase assembly protein [Microbaculum marinisediminis]|uniref:Cytochrome c oxidase assembly protein CtaG n=1 Tax=Microbaculum marinisediminis TaxID=2931392 RepID=A0AAW5QVF5_9HYPH|nr:cytochrome c oxidase assembly protein [Microbaculum sp. A6E488]MCT8970348.1 cytochrome c oxidase assembly protein [Microbaculum sp. A6E488]